MVDRQKKRQCDRRGTEGQRVQKTEGQRVSSPVRLRDQRTDRFG